MRAIQSFAASLWWFRHGRAYQSLLLVVAIVCSASMAIGQDKKTDEDEEEKIPPAVELLPEDLITLDGVQLAATYFPSNKGKDAVPIILLHMHRGSGKDYTELATSLQALGHAVLVPDLRGHGDSRKRRGTPVPIDASKMSAREYANMVLMDMTTLKSFLIRENNAGKLNIEKLVVVGAEMGASVALNWAYYDWSIAPEGNKKQGQDIKALVLISPEKSTPGLAITKLSAAKPLVTMVFDAQLKRAFKDPNMINFNRPVALDFRREVSALIFVGKRDSKAVSDAKRLRDMFKTNRPKAQPGAQQDLFYGEFDTRLQGTKLLGKKLPLEKHIEVFINLRATQRPFPWAARHRPYR